jgi:hypothetical protein
MKRIWFKEDCRRWLLEGKKTTTFRKREHKGEYMVVQGNWYRPKPTGIKVELLPLCRVHKKNLILFWFFSEGDFKTPEEFCVWLKRNKLELPTYGWVHEIKVV